MLYFCNTIQCSTIQLDYCYTNPKSTDRAGVTHNTVRVVDCNPLGVTKDHAVIAERHQIGLEGRSVSYLTSLSPTARWCLQWTCQLSKRPHFTVKDHWRSIFLSLCQSTSLCIVFELYSFFHAKCET